MPKIKITWFQVKWIKKLIKFDVHEKNNLNPRDYRITHPMTQHWSGDRRQRLRSRADACSSPSHGGWYSRCRDGREP